MNDRLNHKPRMGTAVTTDANEAKRKLEALFGGSTSCHQPASQNNSTEKRFASPRKSTGRQPSMFRMRLERLRAARDVEQIKVAADQFLAHHQLPDEADVLYKLLQHPCEKVIRSAMGELSSLFAQGRLPSALLLAEHLNDIEIRAQEEATLSYIKGMREQIGNTPRKQN